MLRPGTGRRRYTQLSEINVTPFVDVMLVLLIVFMVTAPLLTVGVPVDLPKTEAAQLTDEVEPLVVSVRRSEEHTSELQSLMRTSYAVFCLKKKKKESTQSLQTRQRTN